MKTCTKCRLEQPISEFSPQKNTKDGLKPSCKTCARAYAKAYLEKNTITSEHKLNIRLKSLYGITLDEYNTMLSGQAGLCAICKRPPAKERLVVDHCHASGRVRGLLCRNCNSGIGKLGDSIETLRAAVAYLSD